MAGPFSLPCAGLMPLESRVPGLCSWDLGWQLVAGKPQSPGPCAINNGFGRPPYGPFYGAPIGQENACDPTGYFQLLLTICLFQQT